MSYYSFKFSAKFYLCYAYAAFKFNIVAATLNFKISNSPFKEPSSAEVRAGGCMQEIVSGAVLSQASVRIGSRQSPKTHTIADFAIEPYASPRSNSRSLRMSLGCRSVVAR